jgi:hypothetical protein
MPLIPQNEKNAFLSVVKASPNGLALADVLNTTMNYYSDIPGAIVAQLRLYAENNSYLLQAITCFNDNQMLSVGIYVNKNSSAIYNPLFVINSTIGTVFITENSPVTYLALGVFGPTTIQVLSLTPGATLNELIMGPGTTIEQLNGSAVSSPASSPNIVNQISLWYGKPGPSAINSITYGSVVNFVNVEQGSYYAGVSENPDVTCTATVTNLQATNATLNSIYLSWTLPNVASPWQPYLFVNVYFRLSNTFPWTLATTANGQFMGDVGFLFTGLDIDTFYQFNVCCTCPNGGVVCVSVSAKTEGVCSPL